MSLPQVRLLLVDDDPSAIRLMSQMLSAYPDQRFATSGEAALRVAREAPPDLIVLDDDMPGVSGTEICSALKADPALAGIPVIFVTRHGGPARQVAALANGASDFLVKPLHGPMLTARVRARLRDRRQLALLSRSLGAGVGAAPAQEATRPQILIVDDDTASIHILRHTVEAIGELYFAKCGEEALKIAVRQVPDLILLDAHMPGLDGFDVCRSLKAQPPFRHVPIAFVTRFSDPHYEERALDLGAADFIAKPYTSVVLQARVRNLLELKRHADVVVRRLRQQQRRGLLDSAAETDAAGEAPTQAPECTITPIVPPHRPQHLPAKSARAPARPGAAPGVDGSPLPKPGASAGAVTVPAPATHSPRTRSGHPRAVP